MLHYAHHVYAVADHASHHATNIMLAIGAVSIAFVLVSTVCAVCYCTAFARSR